jgi:glycosyltransferase involved in cell wall biosynthesis
MHRLKVRIIRRRPLSWHYILERMAATIVENCPPDVAVRTRISRFESKGILRRLADIFLAARDRDGVHHVLGDVHFLTYLLPARRTILTVLDLVALEKATGLRKVLLFILWYWLPARRCSLITVISEATGRQLGSKIKWAQEKIRVVHCALSPQFIYSKKKFNEQKPVVLHIGTTNNKNLQSHVAALQGMKVKLLVIGRLNNDQRLALNGSNVEYENRYDLDEHQLIQAYRESDILLFCSTYEGFGLPIIEAQATGRPVITSDCFSMPEVAGEGAILCDPDDINSIRSALEAIIKDSKLRRNLVEKGLENCKRFSEKKIAKRYYDLYSELA